MVSVKPVKGKQSPEQLPAESPGSAPGEPGSGKATVPSFSSSVERLRQIRGAPVKPLSVKMVKVVRPMIPGQEETKRPYFSETVPEMMGKAPKPPPPAADDITVVVDDTPPAAAIPGPDDEEVAGEAKPVVVTDAVHEEETQPVYPPSRRETMTVSVSKTEAVMERRRRIDGSPFSAVIGVVGFMVQELHEDLRKLERGKEYSFRLEIKQVQEARNAEPGTNQSGNQSPGGNQG